MFELIFDVFTCLRGHKPIVIGNILTCERCRAKLGEIQDDPTDNIRADIFHSMGVGG